MLTNGRFATIAFAIAGVTLGIAASSASLKVLASLTPSDFPTCAPTLAVAASTSAVAAADIAILRRKLIICSTLLVPVSVCQPDEAELQHDARRQCRRHRRFERAPDERASRQR